MTDSKDTHDEPTEGSETPETDDIEQDEEDTGDDSSSRSESAKRTGKRKPARRAASRVEPKPAASRLVLAAAVALAAGAAGGWFGHIAQAKAKLKSESPSAAGSAGPSGPCGAWQQKICTGIGDASLACAQAKNATDLLTASACEVALETVPATLAKVKAGRVSCDKLVTKLCADLSPGSQTCAMVRERTPSFPQERCDEMLSHYDNVIGELRQMEQQAARNMGAPPAGHPAGAVPGAPGSQP